MTKNNALHYMTSTNKRTTALPKNFPTPQEIKNYLDQYVIGQEETKRILSVAVYNHYKKLKHNIVLRSDDTRLDKSNIILMGPTGSGKTYMVQTIAKMLDVPYYIQDCTKLTASGYVGSDVEDCVAGLLRASGYNVKAAERGIVLLDEIDKIAKRVAGPSIIRDVSGECVQQSLLKIVEGDLVGVQPEGGRKHPEMSLTYIDTSNILFIASGAFVGIEDLVRKRLGQGRAQIGFDSKTRERISDDELKDYISADDIRDFGFIPEFVGRFPVITSIARLEKDDLKRILSEPKNSIISQYVELLNMDNTLLEFDDGAIDEIATIAYNLGTGARALRNIVEAVVTDIMFDAPNNIDKRKQVKLVITRDMVREKTSRKFRFAS